MQLRPGCIQMKHWPRACNSFGPNGIIIPLPGAYNEASLDFVPYVS